MSDQKRNFRHHEMRHGEAFLGNVTKEQFDNFNYRSKRLGKYAYDPDKDNEIIPPINGLYPLFVSEEEVEPYQP